MIAWLKKFARSRCVALLEEEVARPRAEVMRQRAEVAQERAENNRLRAENRALVNSLLGTADFPPVDFPEAPKPQPLPRLRKRSWHQIQAWREARSVAQAFRPEDSSPGSAGATEEEKTLTPEGVSYSHP